MLIAFAVGMAPVLIAGLFVFAAHVDAVTGHFVHRDPAELVAGFMDLRELRRVRSWIRERREREVSPIRGVGAVRERTVRGGRFSGRGDPRAGVGDRERR